MWSQIYALLVLVAGLLGLLYPESLRLTQVDTNFLLGAACFSLGLGAQLPRFKDLLGTSLGLGNIAFSFTVGTFLFPALGLAASVLALQHGFHFAVVVGLAILAACPVGGPSSAVNANTAGGSLEASLLMCLLSTPAALITFPYAYRHFLLLLLDQPAPPGVTANPTSAAEDAALRSQIAQSHLDVPPAAMARILHHALFAAALPLAAGVALGAALPASLAAVARRAGPLAAAAVIVVAVGAGTAARADVVAAGGVALVGLVAALHAASWVLGLLIPAGVRSPMWTCRTTAFQASMRNPSLGLILAGALFGGSPYFPLVAAPCAVSVVAQNVVGAVAALLAGSRKLRRLSSGSASPRPLSPRAFRTQSQESILRQPTVRRLSKSHLSYEESKED